jgi:hypothetical protein
VGQIYFGDTAVKWVRFTSALTPMTIMRMNAHMSAGEAALGLS